MANHKKNRKSTSQKRTNTTHHSNRHRYGKRRIVKWASLIIVLIMIVSVFAGFFVAKF